MQGALGGSILGAGMLAWYPDPYRFDVKGTVIPAKLDFKYIMRNMRGPVVMGAAVTTAFALTECLVEQLRDPAKESTHWNAAVGGAAAGMVMGALTKRPDIMASSALGVGVFMGMVEYNGQTYISNSDMANFKWNSRIPIKEKESDELKALKEKYPEFKDA